MILGMKSALLIALLCSIFGDVIGVDSNLVDQLSQDLKFSYERFTYAAVEKVTEKKFDLLRGQLGILVGQLMMQQLAQEESSRNRGDSGIMKERLRMSGSRPYHTTSPRATAHDHANNIRTIGMAEFSAVLNGVEFRTRHNDYGMRQPSKNSSEYHKVEEIEYPDVPEEVLNAGDVHAQIKEMSEWFKAWKNQDHSVRDYRKYFKATLAYLEGAWTTSVGRLEEPYYSDRHKVDADTWRDLQEKVRFTSYSGTKSRKEDFAYLPTKIMNVINETHYELAQWNYRILVHKLSKDLPLNRFRVVDDIDARMSSGDTIFQHERSRRARFTLNRKDSDTFKDENIDVNLNLEYEYLDEMMAEVPGKDNYPADLEDKSFVEARDFRDSSKKLNAGYYHRYFRTPINDAQGLNMQRRGFHDNAVFVAMTTQQQVSQMSIEDCSWRRPGCLEYRQRWSYAIPLEVVYMTPLTKWNPLNIEFKGENKSPFGSTVRSDGCIGSTTSADKAYNGSNTNIFFVTPHEFFTSDEIDSAPGDTTRNKVGVLDRDGNLQIVRGSGFRVNLPHIRGVGSVRTRYPIMPIHEEGNTVFKHLSALQDITLRPVSNIHMFREDIEGTSRPVTLRTGRSFEIDGHVHTVTLTAYEVFLLKHVKQVTKDTGNAILDEDTTVMPSEGVGHIHSVQIGYHDEVFTMVTCDGNDQCSAPHERQFTVVDKDTSDEKSKEEE